MNNIKLLAIDIAKNVFQLHGNDNNGKCIYKKRLKRSSLLSTVANIPECLIVMESCCGSNYWYRKFTKIGHKVKLIAPQYVKPFVKTKGLKLPLSSTSCPPFGCGPKLFTCTDDKF